MKLKKDRGRFTVRFDMENPDHVRAVEYLERQRDRGKAQYLTDASNGVQGATSGIKKQVV